MLKITRLLDMELEWRVDTESVCKQRNQSLFSILCSRFSVLCSRFSVLNVNKAHSLRPPSNNPLMLGQVPQFLHDP